MNLFPIAVEIGNGGLRAAQWKRRQGRLQIESSHAAPLPLDEVRREVKLLEALRHIRRSGQFSGHRAMLLPPVRSIFTYPLRLSPAAGESVEQAGVRECSKVLPYSPEDTLLDFLQLETETKGGPARAVAIAMQRSQVNGLVALFKRAGLTLEVTDHHLPSLLRLVRHVQGKLNGISALCHLGYHDSFFAVCEEDRLVAFRAIEWGIQPVCDRLSESLKMPSPEHLLHSYGIAPADEKHLPADQDTEGVARVVRQLSRPLLDELIAELHGVLGYVRSEYPGLMLKTVQLFGPGGRLRGLPGLMEVELGLAARVFELPANIWAYAAPPDAEKFELALGLGLRTLPWP